MVVGHVGMLWCMSDVPTIKNVAAEPIPYARVSTAGEMRWILRFLGVFFMSVLVLQFLSFALVRVRSPADIFRNRLDVVGLIGGTLAVCVALGIIHQRRVALILWLALVVATPIPWLLSFPATRDIVLSIMAMTLPQVVLLILIWRRAERRAALFPIRPGGGMNPPLTDDFHWFLGIAGWYVVCPIVMTAISLLSVSLAGVPISWLAPQWASTVLLLGLRLLIGVFLLCHRASALLFLAALYPLSLVISEVASWLASGRVPASMAVSHFLVESLLYCGFALALYWRIVGSWPARLQPIVRAVLWAQERCIDWRGTVEAVRNFGVKDRS